MLDAGQEDLVLAQLLRGDSTFRASSVVSAGHKCLLWIIANKSGKDRVAVAPDTIATYHGESNFPIGIDQA
jgi:hypothetical protein